MDEFEKIYLVWRKGDGERRHAVGVLNKSSDDLITFSYLPETSILKRDQGFTPYTEFQDLNKIYTFNVAEIFGQRLTKLDRPDISTFLKFWEVDIDKAYDKFYLLGKTQGLVVTDNFEFLAEYKLQQNTHFLTELAGLSYIKLGRDTLKVGDELRFELDHKNERDKLAVKIYKADKFVGFIKRFHNKIFHEEGAENLKLHVKALEQNGIVKRAFIKVTI